MAGKCWDFPGVKHEAVESVQAQLGHGSKKGIEELKKKKGNKKEEI